MRYKEFKNAIEVCGGIYNYKTVIEIDPDYIEIAIEDDGYIDLVCQIHKTERFVVDLAWTGYKSLSENARNHLFEIVTEFAATKPEDRKDEKRFIIPLPGLVTTDGKQQYLSQDYNFFASRRNKTLKQTWKEEHLKFVPEIYRQFAVEFDEEEEY